MATVQEIRDAQRANGPASILAIGTANPKNEMYQADYPDFYFRVTNSEHMTDLKAKFTRMCKEAATKAIKEWGQPKSNITHFIFCTTSGVDMPLADYQLTNLLGLRPSVRCFMLYQQGCYAGGTVLYLAKDISENNRGARVLVVCSDITVICFRGPTETHLDSMMGQALFGDGDGAAAVTVGADPIDRVECPLFQLVWAGQTILPDSEGAIDGHLRQVGMAFHLLKDVPGLISKNIEKALVEAFGPIGISD